MSQKYLLGGAGLTYNLVALYFAKSSWNKVRSCHLLKYCMSLTANFPALVTASEAESCLECPQPKPPLPFPATTIDEKRAILPFLVMFLTTRILTKRVINFDVLEEAELWFVSEFFFQLLENNFVDLTRGPNSSEAVEKNNLRNKNGNIVNSLRLIKLNPGRRCLS